MSELSKQVKRATDDNLLIKYKSAGLEDSVIAEKLGTTVEEINIRWKRLIEIANQPVSNGYRELCTQFNTLALQYQLVGESLKVFGALIGDLLSPSELSDLIVEGDKAQTLKNLSEKCLILKPFTPVDPVKALERATQIIQQGN